MPALPPDAACKPLQREVLGRSDVDGEVAQWRLDHYVSGAVATHWASGAVATEGGSMGRSDVAAEGRGGRTLSAPERRPLASSP